jgi:hypothetical protein
MPANFSRVPVSVRACGPASVSPCFVLHKKTKTASELPAKMLLCFKKKETDAEAAQARKEGVPPTTRAFDNPKTDADWQGVCVLITPLARTPQTALLFPCSRIYLLFAELRSRELSGGRERSLALVAKVADYDAECSANYTPDAHTLLCANHRSLRKK